MPMQGIKTQESVAKIVKPEQKQNSPMMLADSKAEKEATSRPPEAKPSGSKKRKRENSKY